MECSRQRFTPPCDIIQKDCTIVVFPVLFTGGRETTQYWFDSIMPSIMLQIAQRYTQNSSKTNGPTKASRSNRTRRADVKFMLKGENEVYWLIRTSFNILTSMSNHSGYVHVINQRLLPWALLTHWSLGAVSIRKTVLPGMAIPMLKIRRPNGHLIFNMEIAIRR